MGSGVPKVSLPAAPPAAPSLTDDSIQQALRAQMRRRGTGLQSTFLTTPAPNTALGGTGGA